MLKFLKKRFDKLRPGDRLVRHLLFLSVIKLVALFGLWLAFFQNSVEITGNEVSNILLEEGSQERSGFVATEGKTR